MPFFVVLAMAGTLMGQPVARPAPQQVPGGFVLAPEPAGVLRGIESPPSLPLVARYYAEAQEYERHGLEACVDLYYRAVVVAYAWLTISAGEPDPIALESYNESLRKCMKTATVFGRLDPRSHLMVRSPAGMVAVPVSHRGFVWSSDDFDELRDPTDLERDPGLERAHVRVGIGTPQVVLRQKRGDVSDAFLMVNHPFAATAVVHPDLGAWMGPRVGQVPGDRLEFLDPKRVRSVEASGRILPMAADLDVLVSMMREISGGNRFSIGGLLRPESALRVANLYMVEPYQRGKIPLVLVHGLASSPLTWGDVLGDLAQDRALLERYQVWLFAYPTGLGFARNAAILRGSLDQIVPTMDPGGADASLRSMVLVGHSMGGLLSKLQTQSSGDMLWNVFSHVPMDQMEIEPEGREMLRKQLFFEPQPYVKRVVFVATPHRGSTIANNMVGRLSSRLILLPDDGREAYRELRHNNPGALNKIMGRRPPTSIDLLEDDHPFLMAMMGLPRAPGVKWHSVVGVGKQRLLQDEPTDGVVPFHSASISGVESEMMVDATHVSIHHQPETVYELRRILAEHYREWAPATSLARGAANQPGGNGLDRRLEPVSLSR